jgi:hypothetical protein
MSLPRQQIPPVPPATAHVAQVAFPTGNVYLQMRDELGSFYDDELFATLYAARCATRHPSLALGGGRVCCNLPRTSVIGRRKPRYELELTGNMP